MSITNSVGTVPTVAELLQNVSYDWNNYIPSEEAFEFFNFMRLVLGEEPVNKNSLAHYYLVDVIFGNVTRENIPYRGDIKDRIRFNDSFYSVLAHREFAKSVIIGTFIPLFIAYKGKLKNRGRLSFGYYIGDSMGNNVKTTMETIASVVEESVFLDSVFESTHFTQEYVTLVRRGKGKKSKRTFRLKGFGAQSGVRGQRSGLDRPQFAIIDDTVKSAKDAESDVILDSISSTIYNDVIGGLSGRGSFTILIGTPYNKKDPVYSAIESGAATPIVFPIAEKLYLGMPKSEFKGSWEDRHSYEKVMKRLETAVAANKKISVTRELMLDIMDEDSTLINTERLRLNPFDRAKIIANPLAYSFYITTDLTTTGHKSSDYAAIGLWAISKDGTCVLMNCHIKKCSVDEQYDVIFSYVEIVKDLGMYAEVGIETDGQQSLHIRELQNEMEKRDTYFGFAKQRGAKLGAKGISSRRSQKDKLERIKVAVPKFDNDKIVMTKEVIDSNSGKILLEQLSLVSRDGILASHDDGIDMISMLFMIDYYVPRGETIEDGKKREYRTKYSNIFDDDIEEEEDFGIYTESYFA